MKRFRNFVGLALLVGMSTGAGASIPPFPTDTLRVENGKTEFSDAELEQIKRPNEMQKAQIQDLARYYVGTDCLFDDDFSFVFLKYPPNQPDDWDDAVLGLQFVANMSGGTIDVGNFGKANGVIMTVKDWHSLIFESRESLPSNEKFTLTCSLKGKGKFRK